MVSPIAKPRAVLGIIGGSGLYDLPGLSGVRREKVRTPFGDPSDAVVLGRLGDQEIAFMQAATDGLICRSSTS